MARIVSGFRGLLGDHLVELCVHGSAALGGFNPAVSDLDFLVVVQRSLVGLTLDLVREAPPLAQR